MKLLIRELEPSDGTVVRKGKLQIGMFSQHHVDQLEMDQLPFEIIKDVLGVGTGKEDMQVTKAQSVQQKRGLSSVVMALITSDCGQRGLSSVVMALITSDSVFQLSSVVFH